MQSRADPRDSQVFRGKREYLVCWKGYRIKEDEWRSAEDVKGSRHLVSEFDYRNPEALQHISTIDFASLPINPISNFTNIPNTYPWTGPWLSHVGMLCL